MTDPTPIAAKPMPSRWTARIGLVLVAALLLSCFGLLIASAHAGQ